MKSSNTYPGKVAVLACLLAVVFCFAFQADLRAQTQNGDILGTVRDPSGALVPGVSVTAEDVQTGVRRTVTTMEDGSYRFAPDRRVVSLPGKPGSVLIFHCNLVHGSNHNMAPLSRKSVIFAYNDIHNTPRPVANPRPDYVVSRNYDVVQTEDDRCLTNLAIVGCHCLWQKERDSEDQNIVVKSALRDPGEEK